MLKAGQQGIDALGSLGLADVVRNELMDIHAQHPKIFDFARAANFVAQAISILTLNVLETQLNLKLDLRDAELVFDGFFLHFAAHEGQRETKGL